MSRENVALVQGIYDAFSTGDMPAVLGPMRSDIVWNEANNFPDAGDIVVGLGHCTGTYLVTGKPQRTQLAHIWRIANGKAVRFQQHADKLHVAQVTGVDF